MKKVVIFFTLLSSLLFVVFFWQQLVQKSSLSEQSRNQAIEKLLGRKVRAPKDLPTGNLEYQGKYFSLSYPASAVEQKQDEKQTEGQRLEFFKIRSDEPKFIFLAQVFKNVSQLASINDYPAVKFRRENSNSYQEKTGKVGSHDSLLKLKTVIRF